MKKIAILVIAALNQPVYVHYLKNYWTRLIRHLQLHRPHIDVYLLFEKDTNVDEFAHLEEHIIVDSKAEYDQLCKPEFHKGIIPGVLSKTIHAFELLQDQYDVFFRTNLSCMIRIPYFDHFVQNENSIGYSGAIVWVDDLRAQLSRVGCIGPDKSIQSLEELDAYKGNSFVSGSGYFLNAQEVRTLVQRKHHIRYDIVDDVSIGLMFPEAKELHGFLVVAKPQQSPTQIKSLIRNSNASQIRLQHFPLDKAQAVV